MAEINHVVEINNNIAEIENNMAEIELSWVLDCLVYILEKMTLSELTLSGAFLVNKDFNQAYNIVIDSMRSKHTFALRYSVNRVLIADRIYSVPIWTRDWDVVHTKNQLVYTIVQGRLVDFNAHVLLAKGITITSLTRPSFWKYLDMSFVLGESKSSCKPIKNKFYFPFYRIVINGKRYIYYCYDLAEATRYRYISVVHFLKRIENHVLNNKYLQILARFGQIGATWDGGFLIDPNAEPELGLF